MNKSHFLRLSSYKGNLKRVRSQTFLNIKLLRSAMLSFSEYVSFVTKPVHDELILQKPYFLYLYRTFDTSIVLLTLSLKSLYLADNSIINVSWKLSRKLNLLFCNYASVTLRSAPSSTV